MSLPRIASYEIPPLDTEQRVDWSPEPARSALLVHDLQKYFLRRFEQDSESPLIHDVVRRIVGLREAAHRAGVPVFFTAQPPRQDPADRALLTDFWGEGLTGDEEAEIVEELAPAPQDVVLDKWRYSAFMRSTLREQLAARGRDQLVITGVYAHIGCLATALDAFMLDVQPFLVRDALADFTAADHAMALRHAAGRCARVEDADAVEAAWASGPREARA